MSKATKKNEPITVSLQQNEVDIISNDTFLNLGKEAVERSLKGLLRNVYQSKGYKHVNVEFV